MLEMPMIQTRGFHNTVEPGRVSGFEFRVRLTYYRGIYLSQLRPGNVIVDGIVYDKKDVLWTVGGRQYTMEAMKTLGDVHWNPLDTAVISVKKPGGLSGGYHEVDMGYAYTSSYLPPRLQQYLDPDSHRLEGPPGFGALRCKRRMIIV